MGNFIDRLTVLHLRIDDAMPMLKEWWQVTTRNVAVLVDRCRQHSTTMLAIPGRIVCTATEKRDPKWGPTNNHFFSYSVGRRAKKLSLNNCTQYVFYRQMSFLNVLRIRAGNCNGEVSDCC